MIPLRSEPPWLPFLSPGSQPQQGPSSPPLFCLVFALMASVMMDVSNNTVGDIHGDAFSHNDNTTILNIYPAAKSPLFYGRAAQIRYTVSFLVQPIITENSKRGRFCILRTGGMGKTSLAFEVSERNLVWGPSAQALSPELLLDTVYNALGISRDSHHTLRDILDDLRSSGPVLLLLDNFETPWNAGCSRAAVARILLDIEQLPNGVTDEPCEEISWKEMRIEPLETTASSQSCSICWNICRWLSSLWPDKLWSYGRPAHIDISEAGDSNARSEQRGLMGVTAHNGLGEHEEAESWAIIAYEERKKLNGSGSQALSLLGKIYISKGDYDRAIHCLVEALKQSSAEGGTARSAFNQLWMKRGDKFKARDAFMDASKHFGIVREFVAGSDTSVGSSTSTDDARR
ncbi:hypothetical protein C8J56DRAFT_1020347, partial [Mycena floridula]